MTELALLMPILLLEVLGAVDLGLALRAHTSLAQVAQQAGQYLIANTASTSCGLTPKTSAFQTCTEKQVADYLTAHSFSCAPLDVTPAPASSMCTVAVTFTAQTVGGQQELVDVISVNDPYSLVFPLPSKLNAGPLHGNTLALNAQVATVAPTDPPTLATPPIPVYTSGFSDAAHLQGYTITWTAPTVSGVTLKYRVYSHHSTPLPDNSTLQSGTSYTDNCGPAATTPVSKVACTTTNYYYEVSAVQPNGMEARSNPVHP